MKTPSLFLLLILPLFAIGCRTAEPVRSNFAAQAPPAGVIRQTPFRLRVQADTEPLRETIENHAREQLSPILTLAPITDGQAGWVDITLLNSTATGTRWKPSMSASFGVSSGGGSRSGLGLGIHGEKPVYPTMVMALKLPGESNRLWHGTTWLKDADLGLDKPEDVARYCVEQLSQTLALDLANLTAD